MQGPISIKMPCCLCHTHDRGGVAADAFNKWEAGQRLAKKLLIKLYNAAKSADEVGCKPMWLLLKIHSAQINL